MADSYYPYCWFSHPALYLEKASRVALFIIRGEGGSMDNACKALLREVAVELKLHAEINFLGSGDQKLTGRLVLSQEEGSLWRRVTEALGGEPDLLGDFISATETLESTDLLRQG